MKATKRFSHGLQAGGAFTLAKGFTRATRQDFFNPASNPLGAAADPAAGADLQLRLHRTPKASFLNNWENQITRGWQIGGYALYQSGAFLTPPASPTANFLTSEDTLVAGQPLYNVNINNIHSYNPATTQVLNPAAWAACPTNATCPASGTLYRNFRGPRDPSENANIGRNFRIKERMNFHIRAEFVNIFNRTLLPVPTTTNPQNAVTKTAGINSSGFGVINTFATAGSQPADGRAALPYGPHGHADRPVHVLRRLGRNMTIARSIFGAVLTMLLDRACTAAHATPPASPGHRNRGSFPPAKETRTNFARGVPARIVDFTAEPASIQPGQSATLTWSTEDPTGITIDPGLGRVAARGVIRVTPAATTTYTLTVLGPNDQKLTRTVTVTVPGTTPLSAEACRLGSSQRRQRLEQRMASPTFREFGQGGGGRGEDAAAAQPPRSTGLKTRRGEVSRWCAARRYGPIFRLHAAGRAAGCRRAVSFRIRSERTCLAILNGYPGTFRIIPTDGGPHPADPDPTWMGDSIGHWEGDTLVVDSVGFNDKTEISGYRHTEALHIVERFRRADYNTLQYEATMEDPNVFVKPWTVSRAFQLRTDMTKVDEFVCEHNPDYSKFFEKK